MPASTALKVRPRAWILLLLLLVAARLPSLMQPAGGDQNLYTYVGQRILAGGVPYLDAWEQKPPAVFFVYAFFWRIWPHESVVAAADLVAAGGVAWLLVLLGRRFFTPGAGFGAAAVFLLLGHPGLQRLSGMMVRSQCETFIALAIAMALVLATAPSRRSWHLPLAGVWLAVAFWLKYNAAVYALPVGLAAISSPAQTGRDLRWLASTLGKMALGFAAVSIIAIAYFAVNGALGDLWRATVDYNVRYSGETYGGIGHAVGYVAGLPFQRVRVDALWFLGGLGAVGLLPEIRRDRSAGIVLVWLAAAILSIAINGSRGLPQYFVQAAPALALAAAGGIHAVWGRPIVWRAAVVLALVAALWRVGDEPTAWWRPRLFGLPQLAGNIRFDVRYGLGGDIPRAQYLERFGGTGEDGKFSALAVEELAELVRRETRPGDYIYVFGFASGGVYAKSGRVSSSRFFWSRPIVIEFAAGTPGYGSTGLLADLERSPPAIIAIQKRDWRIGEPNVPDSIEFFRDHQGLRSFVERSYTPVSDGVVFALWRRRV
jgi:hypothetical protein